MTTQAGNEPKFLFKVMGTTYEISVVDFTLNERISFPFELNASLACEDEIKFDDVVGKEALLTILSDEEDRYCHGIINKFKQTGSKGEFNIYQATVVPSLWLLSYEQDCRIFQNKTVEDMIKQIFQDAGITSDRFDFRLQNKPPQREYCVQYRETDLNFISRLLEEEGIFYFFEHSKSKHVLVFGDSTVAYQSFIKGKADVTFNPAGMVAKEESVYGFSFSQRVFSGKITQRDFNFEKPSLDLKAEEQDKSYQKLEVYDYPGRYLDQGRGKKLSKIRLEESITFKEKAEGQSVCPRFTPGFKFKLTDHDRKSFNQEYLLGEVRHTGAQPQVFKEWADSSIGLSYSNYFVGIPSSVTYRPWRKTPKPFVEGLQTAMVTGPKGEEIYTDEYGRVKVQFHWDREGKKDEKTTCWIRVAYPYAGEKHGAQFTPLVGDEVLVDFLEGDPDKPVITGSLFKGEHKALIPEKEMIKNEILTPYQHRLLFNDKGGSITLNTGGGERLYMGDGKEDKTDHGNNIKISTADGHYIHLAQGNTFKGIEFMTKNYHYARMMGMTGQSEITLITEKGHWILLDDTGDRIRIADRSNTLTVEMNSSSGQIKVENNATGGGWILLECPNGKISLKANQIELIGTTITDIKGGMVKINC
ncbi:MAG: type VI secretion system tip protein VgrG [Deltaproteobacteria bacterium CG_4_8_14_3_um_filter_45_9]|nr:MAG: type VI secretion system tip protein VgrG [Deltaproteobacteria bacterium CG_4_8_14_3_um_filter_45_9]